MGSDGLSEDARTVRIMTASATPTPTGTAPREFTTAVAELQSTRIRPEVVLDSLPAPARLAPYSHAISASVLGADPDEELASGRLILLYDPDGVAAWDGKLRIVIFVTCELDLEIARDVLLPEVAWSWLTDSLQFSGADYTALGGTVTATSSTRFGDIAGPGRADDLEIRASWTPTREEIGDHVRAFSDLLAVAAGLPPEGVATLRRATSPNVR